MSVYNAVGEGPLSPPQEVFVGEAGESRVLIQGPHPALATSFLFHSSLTNLHALQYPQQHPRTWPFTVLQPHS